MFVFVMFILLFLHTHSHKPFTVPSEFSVASLKPNSLETLHITIGLQQNGIPDLHQILQNISNPQSPLYGQWLSREEVENTVFASEHHISKVINWIQTSTGIRAQRLGSDALTFPATVVQIESLFNVTLHHVVPRLSTGTVPKPLIRATDRGIDTAIPFELRDIIEIVSPIFSFVRPQRSQRRQQQQQQQQPNTPTQDPSIIPETLRNVYKITNNKITNTRYPPRNIPQPSIQAVAEMQHALGPEGFDPDNLNKYQQSFFLTQSLLPTSVVGVNDGIDPTGECTMDTDLISSIAQGSPTIFWMVDEWMFELGLSLSTSTKTLPNVVSISWVS